MYFASFILIFGVLALGYLAIFASTKEPKEAWFIYGLSKHNLAFASVALVFGGVVLLKLLYEVNKHKTLKST